MMSTRAGAARLRYTPALVLVLPMAAGGSVAVHERHRWRERLSPLWVRTLHDVPYGPRPENRLDVLRRRWGGGPENAAAVVVFHGGDRRWIVVTGESAGAHLALMAAFAGEPVFAVVDFYGVSDLAAMLRYPSIRRVLPEQRAEAAAQSLSPLKYIRPGQPPVLSIHGTADAQVLLAQSAALTRACGRPAGTRRNST